MDKELFKDHSDYWQVADNIRNIYMSEGSLTTLLDFERVLDEVHIYAFKNWEIGELVDGPEISKYRVTCTFMWPGTLYRMMHTKTALSAAQVTAQFDAVRSIYGL